MLRVQVTLAIRQIFVSQQHLGNVLLEAREETLIQRHQLDLPHRRQRLFLWNGLGSFLDAETGHSGGYRAGAHHNDLFFLTMELGEIVHQSFDSPLFDPAVGGEDLTPDLDDDPAATAQDLLLIIQLRRHAFHPVVSSLPTSFRRTELTRAPLQWWPPIC